MLFLKSFTEFITLNLFLFNILKKRSGSKAAILVLLYIYYSRYSENYIYQYYKHVQSKYTKAIEDKLAKEATNKAEQLKLSL